MTVLSYHGIRIDWLKPLIPVYLHILDCATEEIWLNQPIRIASAEGLILLKLLAFRSHALDILLPRMNEHDRDFNAFLQKSTISHV